MIGIVVFCALCILLFIGKAVRVRVPLLQRLYLPSSLVGGIIGLVLVSVFRRWIPSDVLQAIGKTPGFLINVVFATLFLGAAVPRLKRVVGVALPQLCLGQILAWGQYAVGLALAGFVFTRLYDVPAAFGNLLEIGFEGGPGTVGGMSESFVHFGWEDGVALGYTVSTVGMILGIVVGMALIQWAYRRGIVRQVTTFEERRSHERRGLHLRRRRPSAGLQTVSCDSIDSLAWHVAVVGVAMAIGYGLRLLVPMKGFPLFPLCMIGGVILEMLAKLFHRDLFVDRVQMERISGASLDFLLVAAVATIKLKAVLANWQPLLVLILAGTVWSLGVIMFLAPRIFKEDWFERAIAEFGQALGVTATGLMLLRTVDPENRTSAAMSFGYKQLLHEPFMGGGIWTALAFTLVYQIGWWKVWLISLVMLLLWSAVACRLCRRSDADCAGATK